MSPLSSASTMGFRALVILLALLMLVAVVSGVAWMAIDPDDDFLGKCFSSVLLLVACVAGLSAAEGARARGRLPAAMVISMLLTVGGCAGFVWLTWIDSFNPPDHYWKFSMASLVMGFALAHSGAFSLVPVKSRLLKGMKIAVLLGAWAVAALVLLLVVLEDVLENSNINFALFFTLLAVMMLLLMGVAGGTIIVPLAAVSRANKDAEPIESVSARATLTLGCPKCGAKQEVKSGNARCTACGIGLFIEIEEPRCECGYLLYQLQGHTCPECGRALAVRHASDVRSMGDTRTEPALASNQAPLEPITGEETSASAQ